MFYINYEECKYRDTILNISIGGKFYINYEECKWFNNYIEGISKYGFILTMRNVNTLIFPPSIMLVPRFILTMRNVNSMKGKDKEGKDGV